MYAMNPFTWLVGEIISLISFALFIWVIMSLLIQFQILNRNQPLVRVVFDALNRFMDPMLRPIRKYMPDLGGIDISPIVLILALQFIQRSLYYYF